MSQAVTLGTLATWYRWIMLTEGLNNVEFDNELRHVIRGIGQLF